MSTGAQVTLYGRYEVDVNWVNEDDPKLPDHLKKGTLVIPKGKVAYFENYNL